LVALIGRLAAAASLTFSLLRSSTPTLELRGGLYEYDFLPSNLIVVVEMEVVLGAVEALAGGY
jgi:hypothetical protein